MDREGIDHWNEFEAKIGMRGAASRWKTGEKPTPESLIKIKKAFNISIDWLLTGKEPAPTSQEIAPQSDQAGALALKDFELLNESITKVEEEVNEAKKILTVGQYFKLILRVYNDCIEFQKKPDRDMVKRYLSVMI